MIGIVDYGLGNVQAFVNTYRRLGIVAAPVSSEASLLAADKLILPGVGAFDWAMERLDRSGLREALCHRVLVDSVPVLGVCVGMQIMADRSEEGIRDGLGWISGEVMRFKEQWFSQKTHLPQMGWNDVNPVRDEPLFAGIESPRFYFLHSYYFSPTDFDHVIGTSMYGIEFASAVRKDNIWATQFHPEKSHSWGIELLRNFAGV